MTTARRRLPILLALFAPGSVRLGELDIGTGATIEIAAPAFSTELRVID